MVTRLGFDALGQTCCPLTLLLPLPIIHWHPLGCSCAVAVGAFGRSDVTIATGAFTSCHMSSAGAALLSGATEGAGVSTRVASVGNSQCPRDYPCTLSNTAALNLTAAS